MANEAAAQSDRDLASIAEARALARRAKQAWLTLAEFSQTQIDAIVDAMAEAATPQARGLRPAGRRRDGLRRRRRQDPEEPLQLAEGPRLHQADEDRRRDRAPRGSACCRDRGAVRRRRGGRSVHEPDVDRDLQDSDFAQGAMRDRDQSASRRRQVHHARRRGDGRGGPARRGAGRRHQLDDARSRSKAHRS